MRRGRQASKSGNMQKKANANMPYEVELTENERRITLTLHVKPRLTEHQTGESEDRNCLPPILEQQQQQENNDLLAPLFVKTNILDEKIEQEFPAFITNQANSTSPQASAKLANTSTPHKSSARRSASQTPKRNDVLNREDVNAQVEDDISLHLWSWQDTINITSLRHLCDDKYYNVVQIVQRVTASLEETRTSTKATSGIFGESVWTSNASVNTTSTIQSNDNKDNNYNQQRNEQSNKLTNSAKCKSIEQVGASKNLNQQQLEEKEQQYTEKLQKQKVSKEKNVTTKAVVGNKQATSKKSNKNVNNSNNINSASNTINNASSKHDVEKVEKVDMVVAEMYIHLSDLLHQSLARYTVKLESKHADWIEECWLELKCEKLPLLTSELIKLYRPVMVTVELSDFLTMFNSKNNNKEMYDENKENQSTKQIASSQRQHNMWLRLRAFDQVKSHHVMVKPVSYLLKAENNSADNLTSDNSNVNKADIKNYDLVQKEWQTIFFLGDIPMLHVYQFLFFNKMTIELYVSEATHTDTNTAMHTFNVNESTLIGNACISLKEYLMLNHTLHEETVQLLPSERASHALSEYNMTSAATVGISVNFYLPFPPITHVRDVYTMGSNTNDINSESNECTDTFLTRGIMIMPYADEWVGKVIQTFIEEVKKRPAVHDRNNGELYLYSPPSMETDESEVATATTKNVSNERSTITSKSSINAKLSQQSERQQSHRQEKDQTKEHENLEKNKTENMRNSKQQEERHESQEVQRAKNANIPSGKDNNKRNTNKNNTSSRSSKVNRRNSHVGNNERELMAPTETESSTFAQPFQVVTPDIISGFEVMDGCSRVICIEGPMKDVQAILEAVTVSANNHPALRVLFNSELFIPHREYGTFPPLVTLPESEVTHENEVANNETHANRNNDDDGYDNKSQGTTVDLEHSDAEAGGTGGRIHRVRVSESISSICNHEKYWLHRILSNSCAECIRKLSALLQSSSPSSCTTMRAAVDHDLLPSSLEIIALERAFGQTLSNTDLYSIDNNKGNFETCSKSGNPLALQEPLINEVQCESKESVESKTAIGLENEIQEGSNHEVQSCCVELCSSNVGKVVSFHGMIDSASTRLIHKELLSELKTRYQHICYMSILDDTTKNEGKCAKSNSFTSVEHTRNKTSMKMSVPSKTRNSFLCGFVRHKPAPSIAYRVDGQIVSYNSHVLLLHILSLECLIANITNTSNTLYDKLLRQRHREECYRTLHNTTNTTTTAAAVKHKRKSEYTENIPIAEETENKFIEYRVSTIRKAENENDKHDDEDNDNVWLVDKSWEFEEQTRQLEFVRKMQEKNDQQQHTVRATQQSIKLAQLHKQPTIAEKAAEYALWWKLYNARAPATEVKPAKYAVMRFSKLTL